MKVQMCPYLYLALFITGTCLSAAGCTSAAKLIETPKVTLRTVKVTDPTTKGATLIFGLLVENPNSIALEVDELTYDIEISGTQLSSGRVAHGAKVAAKANANLSIPIFVKYADLFTSLVSLLSEPASPYRIKGAARVGPFQIPFDQSGEINLSGATPKPEANRRK